MPAEAPYVAIDARYTPTKVVLDPSVRTRTDLVDAVELPGRESGRRTPPR